MLQIYVIYKIETTIDIHYIFNMAQFAFYLIEFFYLYNLGQFSVYTNLQNGSINDLLSKKTPPQ